MVGYNYGMGMAMEVTKKVRLSRTDARRLARVAREAKRTESQILREGLDLVERVRNRRRAMKDLIALIDSPEPPKRTWATRL
jgi:hypothetical protein